jgi:hypothetical protein
MCYIVLLSVNYCEPSATSHVFSNMFDYHVNLDQWQNIQLEHVQPLSYNIRIVIET